MTARRARSTVGVALAAVGVALGCAGAPSPRALPATDEETRAYAGALATLADDPATTERALERFLAEHPRSPLADDAATRLGELALARGDVDTALRHYGWVEQNQPDGDRVDAARVEMVRLELARGNRAAAASRMRRVRLSRLSSAERRVAFRVLADSSDDPVEKLRWLARVRGAETDEDALALVDVEIDEQITQLDRPDLVSAADQIGREIPAGRALLEAADRALDAGDLETAQPLVHRASRLTLAPAYRARLTTVSERLRLQEEGPVDVAGLPTLAEALARETPSVAGAAGTIGVVVPLSGRFARFGEESLQGVLLAAGIFGDGADDRRMRVLVRDTGGRPERAARAVQELAAEDVVAIVGPLLKGECEAAAGAAENAGVPLLALTAREEVAAWRPHVFRVRTRPEEEVQTLVHLAIQRLRAQRFAILYPRDSYGLGLRRLFWRAVEEQGGRIVGVASYDPDATDFEQPIRRLVGYSFLTPEEKEALKEREELERRARRLPAEEAAALRVEAREMTGPDEEPLPPIVDFDALFIPESYDKVVLIAPQLAFHEAAGATLLGTNGWYHPDLTAIGRGHVDGAYFTTHYHGDSSLAPVREFARSFGRAFASPPDVFAAQAYDAANLVLVQLARDRTTREDVREGVLGVTSYPGVTGVIRMRSDGNARKRPFLLRVERRRVRAVELGDVVPLEREGVIPGEGAGRIPVE